MCVISRKRGECVRIGEDLHIRVLRTGADVVLQLRGRYQGTFTLARGQVQTIGPQLAVKALSLGLEPKLYFLASEGIGIVRCELPDVEPSLVDQLRREIRRRQQCEQAEAAGTPQTGLAAPAQSD